MAFPSTHPKDKCYGKKMVVPIVGMTPMYVEPVDVQEAHLSWVPSREVQVLGGQD